MADIFIYPQTHVFIATAGGVIDRYFKDEDPSNDHDGALKLGAEFTQAVQSLGQIDGEKALIHSELIRAYQTFLARYGIEPVLAKGYDCFNAGQKNLCWPLREFPTVFQEQRLFVGDAIIDPKKHPDDVAYAQANGLDALAELRMGPFDSQKPVKITLGFRSVQWTKPSDLDVLYGKLAGQYVGSFRVVIVPEGYAYPIPPTDTDFPRQDLERWAAEKQISIDEALKYFTIIYPLPEGHKDYPSYQISRPLSLGQRVFHRFDESLFLKPYSGYRVIAQAGTRADSLDRFDTSSVLITSEGFAPKLKPRKADPPNFIRQTINDLVSEENPKDLFVILSIDGSSSMLGWTDYLVDQAQNLIDTLAEKVAEDGRIGVRLLLYKDHRQFVLLEDKFADLSKPESLEELSRALIAACQVDTSLFDGKDETFWETVKIEAPRSLELYSHEPLTLMLGLTDGDYHLSENTDFDLIKEVFSETIDSGIRIAHLHRQSILQQPDTEFDVEKLRRVHYDYRASTDINHIHKVYETLPLELRGAYLATEGYQSIDEVRYVTYKGYPEFPSTRDYLEALKSFAAALREGRDVLPSLRELLSHAHLEDLYHLMYELVATGYRSLAISVFYCVSKREIEDHTERGGFQKATSRIFTDFGASLSAREALLWQLVSGSKVRRLYLGYYADQAIKAVREGDLDAAKTLLYKEAGVEQKRLAILHIISMLLQEGKAAEADFFSQQLVEPADQDWAKGLIIKAQKKPIPLDPQMIDGLSPSNFFPEEKGFYVPSYLSSVQATWDKALLQEAAAAGKLLK